MKLVIEALPPVIPTGFDSVIPIGEVPSQRSDLLLLLGGAALQRCIKASKHSALAAAVRFSFSIKILVKEEPRSTR